VYKVSKILRVVLTRYEFFKILALCHTHCRKNRYFTKFISRKDYAQKLWNFVYNLVHLRSHCGQSFRAKFENTVLLESWVLSDKIIKKSISQKQRREGMNPFQLFHTSLRSTYVQNMESKWLEHLGTFPRKQ
jgi:hypothetical protein